MKKVMFLLVSLANYSICMKPEAGAPALPVYPARVYESKTYRRKDIIGEITLTNKLNKYERENNLKGKSLCFKGTKVDGYKKIFSIPGFKYEIPPESNINASPMRLQLLMSHTLFFSDEEKHLYMYSTQINPKDRNTAHTWLHRVTAIHLLVEKKYEK